MMEASCGGAVIASKVRSRSLHVSWKLYIHSGRNFVVVKFQIESLIHTSKILASILFTITQVTRKYSNKFFYRVEISFFFRDRTRQGSMAGSFGVIRVEFIN